MTATTTRATAPATPTADAALEEEEAAEVCRASPKGTRGSNAHMIIATCYNGIDANRFSYCCPSIKCGTISGLYFRFSFNVY